MNADTIISALDFPDSAWVNQRVPKKMLVENGAPTAADKRRINEGIEEIHWLAALKPNTIGVPDYRDDVREYLEIALLTVTLRPEAKAGCLTELIHRAIPYPLFLILLQGELVILSLAHKRRAQNEAGRFVLDGEVLEVTAPGIAPLPPEGDRSFLDAIALGNQPRTNLLILYQGWIDTLVALQASLITRTFRKAGTYEAANAQREAVLVCKELEIYISTLRNNAVKERQIAKRIELNLEIKELGLKLADAKMKL